MQRPGRFTPGKDLVAIVQEAGWAPGPVWTGAEYLAPTGIRTQDRPALGESLNRMRYPAHFIVHSRGDLSYLAPLGSENISAPYFKQCFFRGGDYPPDSQTPRLPVPRQK